MNDLTVIDNGKRNLAEQWTQTELAFQKTQHLQNIWTRSHSKFDWENLVFSYHSPWKNIRQVAAELNRKRSALSQNKWNLLKTKIEIQRFEQSLASAQKNGLDDLDRELLEIEINSRKEQMEYGIEKFEGAMRDVRDITELYDKMIADMGEITEEEFLRAERKNHLQRSLVQSIRDMRGHGLITKGEQEYLEQCGANPSKVAIEIRKYLRMEQNSESWGTESLREFVNDLADKIITDTA